MKNLALIEAFYILMEKKYQTGQIKLMVLSQLPLFSPCNFDNHLGGVYFYVLYVCGFLSSFRVYLEPKISYQCTHKTEMTLFVTSAELICMEFTIQSDMGLEFGIFHPPSNHDKI